MKTTLTILLTLLLSNVQAQSWQWGKRGGGDQAIGDLNSTERVRMIKTDTQGNVYAICPVSTPNLNIDGNPKTGYSNGNTYDYALTSFACDGTYRWSKVIGGQSIDYIDAIQIDAQDNVYVSGRVAVTSTGSPPIHFDDDLVLPQSPFDVNTFKKGMFLIKYDSDGTMLWMEMPQPEDISLAGNGQCVSLGLSTDQNGSSYWFTRLVPGNYENGAYIVSGPDPSFHVLKYDSSGSFIEGVPISVSGTSFTPNIKFAVNHQTGVFYFAGFIYILSGGAISFNGQPVTNDMYLAAYDSNGDFLWVKESSQVVNRGTGFTDLHINSVGNIYLSGGTGNGMVFGTHTFTSATGSNFPFILKTNANGDIIWGTNASTTASSFANGISEGATTGGFAGTLTWGGHNLSVLPNTGYDVFMTRFNPATGEIIALETLVDDDGYADYGTAITKDLHGNFYVGGRFEHFLYVNTATPMINDGPQTDFFIAKFGSSNCDLGVEENTRNGLNVYPNPVDNILNLPNMHGTTFSIHSILGQVIQSGTVDSSETLNLENLRTGIYILQITSGDESYQAIKILKN